MSTKETIHADAAAVDADRAGIGLTVNGRPARLDGSPTVAALLARYNLARAACAVEVNRRIVPKRRHADHLLHDGDAVEIVTLVGGG
jgi:sulfur carrier protein